ncbi:MAG TPA: hypothetical protein VFV72_14205 [Candidatus Limnocylindrales bacterium]|nr:hypothetical protein [Candidatus Limnocylindrales bacterium]
MPRLSCPRRASLVALAAVSILAAAACGSTQVSPTGSAPSAVSTGPAGTAGASSGSGPSPATSGSPGAAGSQGAVAATPVPPDEPGTTPPPAGDPQDDEACLAILPRANVEATLGTPLGGVVAIGTDPAVSLSCTYSTANGGSLLVATTAGDVASAYQSSLDLATGYEQHPVAVEGLGGQAFYAAAADRWPEEVVIAKGPVLIRLVNQTSATIGQAAFVALATTAADAIRAEIPPAP